MANHRLQQDLNCRIAKSFAGIPRSIPRRSLFESHRGLRYAVVEGYREKGNGANAPRPEVKNEDAGVITDRGEPFGGQIGP